MLFNNFSVTQTSDDMLSNYAAEILKGSTAVVACDDNEGGARLNTKGISHIDANRLSHTHLNRFPMYKHADLQQSAEGYSNGEEINFIVPHTNQTASAECVPSAYNPVNHFWELQDDGDEGQPPLYYTGDKTLIGEAEVHLPNGRPAIYCNHAGQATDVPLFRRRAGEATGNAGSNLTMTYLQNFTMFMVFQPTANDDLSAGLYSGFRMMNNAGNADYLEFMKDGEAIRFRVNAGTQQEVDISNSGTCDIQGRVKYKKFNISDVQNGANNQCDTMIFCITYVGNDWSGLHPKYGQANHVSSPLYHDKTFWQFRDGDAEELYRNEIGANDTIIIENQYGVLLNNLGAIDGNDPFDFRFINTPSGGHTTSLQGYFCEFLVTGQPIGQRKRLHILNHLRRKWGIQDSYANGLPYHD